MFHCQSLRFFSFFLLIGLVKSINPIKIMSVEKEGPETKSGYNTPSYKILEKTKNYELREYEPTHWVSTSSNETSKDQDKGMFWRLFYYIGGSNEEGKKFSMTVPVAIKVEPGQGSPQELTMNFFLTSSGNPKPTDPNVFLTYYPKLKVYVRTYGGYNSKEKRKENIEMLMKDVDENNYDISHYFSCGYDPPWKFWNRHNEVWLLSKD